MKQWFQKSLAFILAASMVFGFFAMIPGFITEANAASAEENIQALSATSAEEKQYVLDLGSWSTAAPLGAGHLQGICSDDEGKYMYASFTNMLVKVDMATGEIVGSVTGLSAGSIYSGGHIGDICYYDGKIYGSLEYKASRRWYICVFDGDMITGMDTPYTTPGLMYGLYVPQAGEDFQNVLDSGEDNMSDSYNSVDTMGHRYGTAGFDGITFGTLPGKGYDRNGDGIVDVSTGDKRYMIVAAGPYGNAKRYDNENFMFMVFDPDDITSENLLPFTEEMLTADYTENQLLKYEHKIFCYAGNQQYGVQQLEYDEDTGDWWLECYDKASGTEFPAYSRYVIDGSVPLYMDTVEVGQSVTGNASGFVTQAAAHTTASLYTDYEDGDGDGNTTEQETGWHATFKCLCGNGKTLADHEAVVYGATGKSCKICGKSSQFSTGLRSLGNDLFYGATNYKETISGVTHECAKAYLYKLNRNNYNFVYAESGLAVSGWMHYDLSELDNGTVKYTGTSDGTLELDVPVGSDDDFYVEAVLKQGEDFDMSNLRYGFLLADNVNFNIVSKNNIPSLQMTEWSFYNNYAFNDAQLAAFAGDGLRFAAARIDGVYKMYVENNGKMVCVASQEIADKATAAFNLKLRCYATASGAEFNKLNWKIGNDVLPYYAEGSLVVSGADKYDVSELGSGKVVYTGTAQGILELNVPVGANDDIYAETVLKQGDNFNMADLRYGFYLAEDINFNVVSKNSDPYLQMTDWSFYNNYNLNEAQLAAYQGEGLRIGVARIDGVFKMYADDNGKMVCVASQEVTDKATTAFNLKLRCYPTASGAEFNQLNWKVGTNVLPYYAEGGPVISGLENFDVSKIAAGKVTYTGTKAASLEFNAPVGANDDVYAEMVLRKGEDFDMTNLRLGFKLAGVHFNLTSNTSRVSLQITNWSFYENYVLSAEEIAAFESDGLRIGAARIDGIYYMYIENDGKMARVLTKEIADKATAEFNINIESYATSPYAEFTQLYWEIGDDVLPSYVEGANPVLSGQNNYDISEIANGKATYIGTAAAILELNAPVGASDNAYMEVLLKKGAEFDMSNLRYGLLFDNINFNVVSGERGSSLQVTNWNFYHSVNLTEEQVTAFENQGLRIAAARIDGVYYMYMIDDNNNLICVAEEKIVGKENAEFNLSIRSWPTAKNATFENIRWNVGENVIPDDLVYNPNNYAQDTYNYSGSPIINEAIVAWNSDSTYENVLSNTKKPSHFIIQIDAALNVSAMDGTQINGSLGDIASNIIKTQNAIPVVAIDSQEEADALTVCLNTNGLRDIMVLSSDASLLNTVLTNTSGVLGVWDLSAETKTYSADELGVITQNANSNHIRIILLSSKSADYESVRMLQKRTMTVWASVTNEDDVAVYRMLSNGVDGVVTNSYSDVHSAMNVFTGNNVLLRLPTLTAHRGYVYGADGSVFPEVSVDALKQAAEYGADAVELDVYSTSDGVLVLHHDATTDRVMTSVSGDHVSYNIAETTYETLYNNLVYKESYSKDKDGNFVERRIEKLEDVFAAFADDKDTVIFVELKSADGTITVNENYQYDANGTVISLDEYVARELARLTEKYNITNQCVTISFDGRFLTVVNRYCPGMSIGYLQEEMPESLGSTLLQAESVNGRVHPQVLPSDDIVRGLYARGATLYTWTKNGSTLESAFVSGKVQGVTTDDINKVQSWVEHIVLNDTNIMVNAGQEIDFGASAMTYLGNAVENAMFTPVVIAGNDLVATGSGYMLIEGTTTVMLRYVAQTDGGVTYTLYSNPLTIEVDDTAAFLSIVDNGDSLSYILTPENTSAVVTWNSNNENVVKIDENGNLTYVGAGTATITASCDSLTATKDITVCAVSYDAAGHGEDPATVLTRIGNTVTAPVMADNGDWIFKAWYIGDTAFDFNAPITESITLTAKWTNKNDIYDIDFEDVQTGDYLVQDGNSLWMDRYEKGWSWVDANAETGNKYLVVSGAEGDAYTDFWFNNVPMGSTLSFDFCMPTTSNGWDRLAIAIGSSDVNYSWRFEQWQGWTSVKYADWDGNEQVVNEAFAIGTWYSVKMDWNGEQVAVKLWAKGTEEPVDYTFVTTNSAFTAANAVRLNYTTSAQGYLALDNIHFYDSNEPTVEAWNITLGDDIGLNFLLDIDENILSQTEIQISVAGEQVPVETVKNSDGKYLVSINLAAAQMTDAVRVKLLLNGSVAEEKTYTVRQYADHILYSDQFDETTKNLVRAMLIYGGKAQNYFAYNTNNYADVGIEYEQAVVPAEIEPPVLSGAVNGLKYYGSSMLFTSKHAVRYYFTLSDGADITDYTFTAGEKTLTAKAKDGMYYVDVAEINPQDLDEAIEVMVTCGESVLTVGYSPMHYIVRKFNGDTSGELKALLQAMYTYHLAAEAYIAAKV